MSGEEVCDNCGDVMRDGRPCDCSPGPRCNLCDEEMPEPFGPQEILDHIRVVHPEHYEEPERWPDGGVVIYEGDIDAGAEAITRGER